MERVFEEDLANARQARLIRTARGSKVRAGRAIDMADRRVPRPRRQPFEGDSGAAGTITRAGSVAPQQSGAPYSYELTLAVTADGALLGTSVLGARSAGWGSCVPTAGVLRVVPPNTRLAAGSTEARFRMDKDLRERA